jgi:hypothetical protein
MKLTKTASGKQKIRMSRKEWQNIGKKAGWMKKANDMIDGSGIIDGQQNFDKFIKDNKLKLLMDIDNTATYQSIENGRMFEVQFSLEYREKSNNKNQTTGLIIDCTIDGETVNNQQSIAGLKKLRKHKDYYEYPPIRTYEISEINNEN